MSTLAVVTGASGFVGSHALAALAEAGFAVRGTDLRAPADASLPFVRADLTKRDEIRAAFEGADVVVNVASVFDYSAPWPLLKQVNVDGMRTVCEAALDARVERFVHVSSAAVYGAPLVEGEPIREDHPQRAARGYDLSKKLQEDVAWEFARERGLPLVVMRPAPIYGRGARYGIAAGFEMFARGALAGYPRNIAQHTMPVVNVEDVARALAWAAKDAELGEAYNIADDNRYSMKETMEFLAPLLGTRVINFPPVPKAVVGAELELLARWSAWQARRHGLPRPAVERDAVAYFRHDFRFSNEKIRSAGFRLKWPDTLEGLYDALPWYLDAWGVRAPASLAAKKVSA
ncbi:MAG: NAD-dependent epimerase/dehydratase family protein [Thermoplasmatota archaeon]